MKTKMQLIVLGLVFLLIGCGGNTYETDNSYETDSISIKPEEPPEETPDEKPVIYLYPEEVTEISVSLDYNGTLLYTYPHYENGWEVTAYPNGTIEQNGNEYSYLFWEGNRDFNYDLSEGFVVRGEDTEAFLLEKLQFLGLTPREYNEFIVYWLPRMVNNPYNLISFQEEAYTENAVLDIYPRPDSIQRVFMAYMALEEPVEIPPQELQAFTRTGFTVIEWGGCELINT